MSFQARQEQIPRGVQASHLRFHRSTTRTNYQKGCFRNHATRAGTKQIMSSGRVVGTIALTCNPSDVELNLMAVKMAYQLHDQLRDAGFHKVCHFAILVGNNVIPLPLGSRNKIFGMA